MRDRKSNNSTIAHYTARSISYPEPSNFLRRMLDENEGSGKDQFLGDPDWLSEMQYNKSAICGLLEPVLSRVVPKSYQRKGQPRKTENDR